MLRELTTKEIVEASGLDRSTVGRARAGVTTPHPSNREVLTKIAAEYARGKLLALGYEPPRVDLLTLCAHRALAAT